MESTYSLKKGEGGQDLKGLLEMEEALKRRFLDLKRQLVGINSSILEKEDRVGQLKGDVEMLNDLGHLGYSPEYILPKEMWHMILKNLTDDYDINSARNTCELFKNLLPPLKSKVSEGFIVARGTASIQLQVRQHSNEDRNASYGDQFRFLMRQKFDETFRCPNVWNGFEVVEHITRLRSQQNRIDFKSIAYFHKIHEQPQERTIFNITFANSSCNYNKKTADVEQTYFWEFIRNVTEVVNRSDRDQDPSWLLTKFFRFMPAVISKLDGHHKYQFFTRDLFRLCSHLKGLCIGGLWDENVIPPTSADIFPPVPELEFIQIVDGVESVSIVQALLERFSAQIKILEVANWGSVSHFNWNSLEELHMSKIESGKAVQRLSSLDLPKLKNLCLHLTKTIPLNDILEMVNNLGAAATSKFCLHLKISENAKIDQVLTPNGTNFASKLKNLELHFGSSSPEDYLLLLRLPFLEKLIIRAGPRIVPQNFSEVVEVHKFFYSREMCKSNIWELLPRLQEIACAKGNHTYKRKIPVVLDA